MIRYLLVSLAVLLAWTVEATAQPVPAPLPQGSPQIMGRVKSVDAATRRLTLLLPDNKEMTMDLAREVKVFGTFAQGRFLRRQVTMELANGVEGLQPNTPVVLTTILREGRPHVSEIRIEGVQRGVVVR